MTHPWRTMAVALIALPLTTHCASTYHTPWYAPEAEVHELHAGSDATGDPVASTRVELVGVLRSEDAAPRRIHARLEVHNRSDGALELPLAEARAVPSGTADLPPRDGAATLLVPAGERRTAELLFPVPDDLPHSVLDEIEVRWITRIGPKSHTSRARFSAGPAPRRWRGAWSGSWGYHPWHGPAGFYGAGYWGSPYCW